MQINLSYRYFDYDYWRPQIGPQSLIHTVSSTLVLHFPSWSFISSFRSKCVFTFTSEDRIEPLLIRTENNWLRKKITSQREEIKEKKTRHFLSWFDNNRAKQEKLSSKKDIEAKDNNPLGYLRIIWLLFYRCDVIGKKKACKKLDRK